MTKRLMVRHWGVMAVLTLGTLSCDSNQKDRAQLTASSTQAGVEDIAIALRDTGSCGVFSRNHWTYATTHPDKSHVWYVLKNQNDGHFIIVLSGVDAQMGDVFLNERRVYWLNTRDYNPTTDQHPSATEGESEWGTPRGLLARRLVEKAEKACESGPADTSPK